MPPANFFGFVDAYGNLLPPPDPGAVGSRGTAGLDAFTAQLGRLPDDRRSHRSQEIGYIFIPDAPKTPGGVLDEVIVSPIEDIARSEQLGGLLTLTARGEDGFAVVEVTDIGTGMSEAVRRRCLEPFFSTKGDKGTGLGLSMVVGIIQRHHGTVEIDSHEGEGSTFRVRLPVHHANLPVANEKTTDAHGRRLLRVLAVDDEGSVREILTHLLEGEGHCVVIAGGARGKRWSVSAPRRLISSSRTWRCRA